MRSPLARDALTVWHSEDRGRSWRATVYGNVRVEVELGSEAAPVGPNPARALRAWVFRPAPVAPGDYALPGASWEEEPPAGAFRVTFVRPWSLAGRDRHTEIEAR